MTYLQHQRKGNLWYRSIAAQRLHIFNWRIATAQKYYEQILEHNVRLFLAQNFV